MRIGIDLGGTKIEAIAIAADGRELLRRRIDAPRGDYDRTLAAIARLVDDVERETGERGTVGVGMPGTISPATGLVKNANSTWLIGRPLAVDLTRRMGRPIRFANDANCFALSEATDGAAAGASIVFGVIVGTGTGGGVVIDGRVVTGANAIAGEWGHNPLPAPLADELPGPRCYCGRTGCIETFLSGPGLVRDYESSAGLKGPRHIEDVPRHIEDVPRHIEDDPRHIEDVPRHIEGPRHIERADVGRPFQGRRINPREIVERAARGEADAAAALARYESRMARALASVINILDPDVIVLGGGLSNIDRLYENVPKLWTAHVFSDRVATQLVRAKHGDSSGVRGAAWLWENGR
jgi:fructokinase